MLRGASERERAHAFCLVIPTTLVLCGSISALVQLLDIGLVRLVEKPADFG
jgi:hypothetical protein